jgi:hypothetical protein
MIRSLLAFSLIALLGGSASAQVKLERKYAEGKSSVSRSENKTQQVLTIAGMDIETKSQQFVTAKTTNGQRAADGTLRVETKVDKMQTEINAPGATISFDSGNPDKKDDNPEINKLYDVFRAAFKQVATVVLDKENKITAVEGTKGVTDNVDEAYRDQFDLENRKRAAIQELAALPTDSVKKGDTWTRTEEAQLGGGQTMKFETTYLYKGTVEKNGKTLDQISTTVKSVVYSMDPNAKTPLKVTKSDMKVASSEGDIFFDRDRGVVVERFSKNRFQGPMTFSINGMELPGKVDLTIESKVVVDN